MAHTFRKSFTVEFADTDAAGIMHFAEFFEYMERTEHAFYRSLGTSVVSHNVNEVSTFPRVASQCDYHQPLRFEDAFDVVLLVAEKRAKVLRYQFAFVSSQASDASQAYATGSLTVVHVHKPQMGGPMKSAPLPAAIDEQVDAVPPEALATWTRGR